MHFKSHPLFILFCLFILASCSKNEVLTFSEQSITTPKNSIVDINVPKANGASEVAQHINKTISQRISAALQFNPENKLTNSIEANIDDFNTEYSNFKIQFPESAQEWEAQIDGEVMFNSPELISISLTTYTNTGGAHGILVINFLNFNAATGELMDNKALFEDVTEFTHFAKPYFMKETSEKSDMYLDTENFVIPENIGYSSDGLILLYNTYEIAPYATGITEFVIPFSEANTYLNIGGF